MFPQIVHDEISEYSAVIRNAVIALEKDGVSSVIGFAETIRKKGVLTPFAEYEALKACRRKWAKLRKLSIELPKVSDYECIREVRQVNDSSWVCINHSKGTQYQITREGVDNLSCECPAAVHGVFCSHIQAVYDFIDSQDASDYTEQIQVKNRDESIHEVVNQSQKLEALIDTPSITLVNGYQATKGQAEAIRQCEAWFNADEGIDNRDWRIFVVNGHAGTGKTSLLETLINRLDTKSICFAAPTNKAVKVLRNKIPGHPPQNFMTLASLLGVKPVEDKDQQLFERDLNAQSFLGDYELVIIDESSMISESMHEILLDEMHLYSNLNIKVLFLGDSCQLPPVNESESKAFTHLNQASLFEVVRHDGPILEWASWLASHLNTSRPIVPETSFSDDRSKGLWVTDRATWESQLIKTCKTAVENGEDSDYVRAIAWTNRRVDSLNSKIRAALYPRASQYVPGERLIIDKPFKIKGMGIDEYWLQTSDEVTVMREPIPMMIGEIKALELLVKDSIGRVASIPVLKTSGRAVYQQRLNEFRKSMQWPKFWGLKNSFCEVKYASALTAHKAQGSTFQNVFVDMKDILKCSDKNGPNFVRNHLLYVAASRASHRLVLTK